MMTFEKLHMKSSWLLLELQGTVHCVCVCVFWVTSLLQFSLVEFSRIHFDLFVSRGLIVPSKEKKKDRKSKLMRKLGRSKSEHGAARSQHSHGLVSLLETMRVQMEVGY